MILEDIEKLLIDSDIEEPIFIGVIPAQPEVLVSLFMSGGYTPGLKDIEEPTFQVRVRHNHLKDGYDLINKIKGIIIKTSHFQVENREYVDFFQTSDIGQMGEDENKRSHLSINFRTYRHKFNKYYQAKILVDLVDELKSQELYFIASAFIVENRVRDKVLRDRLNVLSTQVSESTSSIELVPTLIELAEVSLSRAVLDYVRAYVESNDILEHLAKLDEIEILVIEEENRMAQEKQDLVDTIARKDEEIALKQGEIDGLANELGAMEITLDEMVGEMLGFEAIRDDLVLQLSKADADKEKIQIQLDAVLSNMESSADVITELIASIGVKNKKIEELNGETTSLMSSLNRCDYLEISIADRTLLGYSSTLNIPNDIVIDGEIHQVKIINNSAFRDFRHIKEIIYPEGLMKIDARAFQGTGISHVSIPDGVSVGSNTFNVFNGVRTLRIGNDVELSFNTFGQYTAGSDLVNKYNSDGKKSGKYEYIGTSWQRTGDYPEVIE